MNTQKTDDIIINLGEEMYISLNWPIDNMPEELEVHALEEIAQQIFDVMTLEQKIEWDDENFAIDIENAESEIVVKVCYPDNFDLTKIKQIKVLTENFKSLDEVKIAFHFIKELENSHSSESDDCCCSCC